MQKNKIKKYCLLENGEIHSCFFTNGEQRNIYKEGRKWFLDYDVFSETMIITYHCRILKFADTIDKLK